MDGKDKQFVESTQKGNWLYLVLGVFFLVMTIFTLTVVYINWYDIRGIPDFNWDFLLMEALVSLFLLVLYYNNKRFIKIIKG